MSQLLELQRAFARAVLTGDASDPALPAFVGRVSPAIAFGVHHATAMGGLTRALRLTYPTVDSLVGSAFFDHAALAFIRQEPPREANLSAYGDGYSGFLRRFKPAADLAYLPDVADLDLAVDRVQRTDRRPPRAFKIDAGVTLKVAYELRLLSLLHPADLIRALIYEGDADGLSGLDMSPSAYHLAVWRGGDGAVVKRLAEPAALFLRAIIGGDSLDAAMAAATAVAEAPCALAAIQTDVFAAPFSTITAELETFEQ